MGNKCEATAKRGGPFIKRAASPLDTGNSRKMRTILLHNSEQTNERDPRVVRLFLYYKSPELH